MTPRHIMIPDALWDRVRQYAFDNRVTAASVVREALLEFFKGKAK